MINSAAPDKNRDDIHPTTYFGFVVLVASFGSAMWPNYVGLSTPEFVSGVVAGLILVLIGPVTGEVRRRQTATNNEAAAKLAVGLADRHSDRRVEQEHMVGQGKAR